MYNNNLHIVGFFFLQINVMPSMSYSQNLRPLPCADKIKCS